MAAYVEDTIAAIATPPGAGAVSILRLSGRDARAIAARILRGSSSGAPLDVAGLESHRARRALLVRPEDGSPIDDVLLVPMVGPRSYTGEDVVEIHGHGGRVLAGLALRAALGAGARAARPGEFTERAYLNGRIDLCQAEAVADLIAARSEAAVDVARRQLGGDLSRAVLGARDRVLDVRALAEAHLDFPDEDLPAGAERELRSGIASLRDELGALAATFARGRLVRDGVRVVLVGKPNVGKSSLLNAILGRERALVSDEPGTTRDYLEEPVALGGIEALLCDTAGLRDAAGNVERAGVRRSEERIAGADVLVLVLDASRPLDDADRAALERIGDRALVPVRNKCDLPGVWRDEDLPARLGRALACLCVSATTGRGLEELVRAITGSIPEMRPGGDGPVVTNARHHDALLRADRHLREGAALLGAGGELELVAAELQLAGAALDEVVGRSDCEDVLDRIFARFCVGK